MIKTLPAIILLLAAALLLSCSKEGGKCVSNTGTIIKQQRQVTDFDSIRVRDHVNVILTQDTVNKVVVEAGENIINGIVTRISGRELIIENINKCNWLRSYSKPMNVHLSVRSLQKIHYESSGDISCTDTIRSGVLRIEMWAGCGTIDLKVNVGDGYFIQQMGTATMRLAGVCNISSVYAGDYGPLRLENLRTGYTFVTNSGSNDTWVNARHSIEATISSIGNIYYSGDPASIKVSGSGSGKLLPY